jgi:hypothetical protein
VQVAQAKEAVANPLRKLINGDKSRYRCHRRTPLGFGRIVVSETRAPNMLVNLV